MNRLFGSDMFSYQTIFKMLFPLILDQFFVYLISMFTTAMISASSEESVSAVSLVNPITFLVISIMNSIGSGGTVVVAQYKGRGDEDKMRRAAAQTVLSVFVVSFISSMLLIVFANPIIHWMFGQADPLIMQKAEDYLIGFAFSLIPFALYSGAFSVFRGIGATKTCLNLTVLINIIHLLASMLFLNILNLDIAGTALSFILARIIGGGAAFLLLIHPNGLIPVRVKQFFTLDLPLIKSIFKMGVPFAVEQVFFNGGSIIVQTYIVSLGTVSVAANAIANSVFGLFYAAGQAVGTLSITVVGQCMGAKQPQLARMYGKRMLLLGTIVSVLSILILLPLLPFILSLYAPKPETLPLIYQLLWIALIPLPFFWAVSNITPNTLRAAGDANFTSLVSLITMWVVRVFLGYFAAVPLGLGIYGVWICMGLEWVVRLILFSIRFHGSAWLTKKAIE